MLFNLSCKNIKKSIKDYSIYFFTLVIAVSIFYIFNSIGAQNAMLEMSAYKHKMIEALTEVISYLSVFVSIILGFLIIYSNNFLIKRRKKEIGLYLTLGMSKRKVSLILVIETLLVGIVSLAVGLGLGVILSQGLSIIIAKMFEVNLSTYKFVFSSAALIKTLIYFGIIYVLVMIFNVISLSRYKLIDLLYANKKNETVKFRNKYLMIISFILSIVLIVIAYKELFGGALLKMDTTKLLIMGISGALATLLFFFSLSGFVLAVVQKIKPLYYKGLNIFNLKQINNKINSSVISTTIICLMLLLTIGILAGSVSLTSIFNGNSNESNPCDFTLYGNYGVYDEYKIKYEHVDLDKVIKDPKFNDIVKDYVQYTTYKDPKVTYENLLTDNMRKAMYDKYGESLNISGSASIIKESDYNSLAKLFNGETVSIKDGEYILSMNIDIAKDFMGVSYKEGNTITINGNTLKPSTKGVASLQLVNSTTPSNESTIIVKDNVITDELIKNNDYYKEDVLVGNYLSSNKEEAEKTYKDFLENVGVNKDLGSTKLEMLESSFGIKIIVTFICMYLGIIFAISSVTVLAIGELSNSSDNKDRYKVIRQLGADEKMINKALFTQIFITFALPLLVALFHAFFGLREIIGLIKALGDIDITKGIIITTLFMIVVYGGYFTATYLCSKNVIKE